MFRKIPLILIMYCKEYFKLKQNVVRAQKMFPHKY